MLGPDAVRVSNPPVLLLSLPLPFNAFISTAFPSLAFNPARLRPAVLVRTDAVVPLLQHRGLWTQPSTVPGQDRCVNRGGRLAEGGMLRGTRGPGGGYTS